MIIFKKTANDHGGNYRTCCLLDYHYFKDHYKIIVVDLNKKQALNADRKVMQQVNVTGKLKANPTIFLFLKKQKKKGFEFFKDNHESIVSLFYFNIISI